MASRQQYNDEAFERHDAAMKQHDEAIRLHNDAIKQHDAEMKDIREGIAALVHVAGVQNQRLDRLEGGPV
jgi:soluble cytochrome b562